MLEKNWFLQCVVCACWKSKVFIVVPNDHTQKPSKKPVMISIRYGDMVLHSVVDTESAGDSCITNEKRGV